MKNWLFEENGLKIGVSDQGSIDFLVNQEDLPIDFPGFMCFEGKVPNVDIGLNIGQFHLSPHEPLVKVDPILTSGDSLLFLQHPIESNFVKDNILYQVSLIPNQHQRAGKLIIQFKEDRLSFNEVNERLFEIANFVINNISIQYTIPLNYNQFMFIQKDFSVFSIIEKSPSFQSFNGVILEPKCDSEFWALATGNYRKALQSNTPIERFLNLYLAIESAIACIKKELGLNTFRDDNVPITHDNYSEPILNVSFNINSESRFPTIQNRRFFEILKDSNTFKGLRHKAAHAIRHSGSYSLNTSLKDYVTYQEANIYLNHMFICYMNELVRITS